MIDHGLPAKYPAQAGYFVCALVCVAMMADVVSVARQVMDGLGLRGRSVCVGLSGGMDSVVLLHTLIGLANSFELRVSAVHVNHGLHPRAAHWAAFCADLCATHGVPLSVEQVVVSRASGLGIEAAARAQRYAVFAGLQADYLMLAHHLDDQAETLLLQLLRGAGAEGLSAMPIERPLGVDGPGLLRPLLTLRRSELTAYAEANALAWIEDDSNAELIYDRNFLRHKILPLIEGRFPAYRSTLSRSGRNLADVAELAGILGEQDLAALRVGDAIALDGARTWPVCRVLNALRALFRDLGYPAPRRAVLTEAARQAFEAGPEAQVRVDFGDLSLRRYQGSLHVVKNVCVPETWRAEWRGEEAIKLPAGLGVLRFRRATGAGPAVSKLQGKVVSVALRSGGERMALAANRPHRSLRKLYQDADVAPWLRERTPLLFCGKHLVFVPGLGTAAEFQAAPDEACWTMDWVAD
ncbi:MAG TPA: tRNA lysidine(34) synthetase TilS [Burkholderiales bacterium]|nr:tRNA lysidine(34) synthetase TilS [Burkholderiales bacterium]